MWPWSRPGGQNAGWCVQLGYGIEKAAALYLHQAYPFGGFRGTYFHGMVFSFHHFLLSIVTFVLTEGSVRENIGLKSYFFFFFFLPCISVIIFNFLKNVFLKYCILKFNWLLQNCQENKLKKRENSHKKKKETEKLRIRHCFGQSKVNGKQTSNFLDAISGIHGQNLLFSFCS